VEIKTDRLLLREFVEDDWRSVLPYHNNPRYLRFYPNEGENEAEARGFVQRFLDQQAEQPRQKFQLAITLPENGLLIGNVGLRRRGLGGHQTGTPQGDIGYEVNPEYWGQDYATEAARAMLAFGFNEIELHRIWAQCNAENQVSRRVLEKLGMRLEGRLRQDDFFKGRWWDDLIYAILENEWNPL